MTKRYYVADGYHYIPCPVFIAGPNHPVKVEGLMVFNYTTMLQKQIKVDKTLTIRMK